MPRSIPEWIGKTPDAAIPPRVRLRVFDGYRGRCACGCGRKILVGERWDLDHIAALINGGEHRENNLRLILTEHHKKKSAADLAEKAKVAAVREKHLGIKRKRASFSTNRDAPYKKRMDGTVVRRDR